MRDKIKNIDIYYMITAILTHSKNKLKRYCVKIDNKTINFGSSQHENYIIHKDKDRRKRYIERHQKREDWTIKGIKTPGFFSYHLLWTEPTIEGAIDRLQRKYKSLKIINNL